MEFGTIVQVIFPAVAAGGVVLGGASPTLARMLRLRRRPFRWATRRTGGTPDIARSHGELRHRRDFRPSVVGRGRAMEISR